MTSLSLDYSGLVVGAGQRLTDGDLGQLLLDAAGERYEHYWSCCSLVIMEQSGATYLFDLAGAAGAAQEDRTVAAWAITPPAVESRDVSYQRGFPLPPSADGVPTDRGHLIPHLSGGEFGPNIFRQNRALNRGWSEQGKRFRALEREAAVPGTFYFGHLLYDDDTAYPTAIETALWRNTGLHAERFSNRPAPGKSAKR